MDIILSILIQFDDTEFFLDHYFISIADYTIQTFIEVFTHQFLCMLVQFPFMYSIYTCTSLLGNPLTLLMYISHLDLIMSLIMLVTISTASEWLLLNAK